jgi:phage terminase large subunit-like protein
VVVEANNGGDYLPALLAEVDPTVPCRVVHATRGKRA